MPGSARSATLLPSVACCLPLDSVRTLLAVNRLDRSSDLTLLLHRSAGRPQPTLPPGRPKLIGLYYSMTISTRRFFSRLAGVSLGPEGLVRPSPRAEGMRSIGIPCPTR